MKTKRTWIYCRTAYPDARALEVQQRTLEAFAEQHSFEDDGYSGGNFQCLGFLEMLEDARKGVIDLILVKDLSRLGRDYVEVGRYVEKIMPEVTAWQNRPLEAVYPFEFLDAIHYKVKQDHQYQTKAAYVVLGVTMDGTKDILGVWIDEHESSKFWLNVLSDLKSRGVLDVYLFCVDGLKGFVEAIGEVYPHSQVQRCIVHQIRSSNRFVSDKDIKRLMVDLKKAYTTVTEDKALEHLMTFKENWGKQYPSCVRSWEDNWDILSTFFAYPAEIRKIICTTNIIEGLNCQFRQTTKE